MLYSLLKESCDYNTNFEYDPDVDIDTVSELAISSVYECQLLAADMNDNYIVAEYRALLTEGVGDVISTIFSGIIKFIKKILELIANFFKKIFSFIAGLFGGGGGGGSSSSDKDEVTALLIVNADTDDKGKLLPATTGRHYNMENSFKSVNVSVKYNGTSTEITGELDPSSTVESVKANLNLTLPEEAMFLDTPELADIAQGLHGLITKATKYFDSNVNAVMRLSQSTDLSVNIRDDLDDVTRKMKDLKSIVDGLDQSFIEGRINRFNLHELLLNRKVLKNIITQLNAVYKTFDSSCKKIIGDNQKAGTAISTKVRSIPDSNDIVSQCKMYSSTIHQQVSFSQAAIQHLVSSVVKAAKTSRDVQAKCISYCRRQMAQLR